MKYDINDAYNYLKDKYGYVRGNPTVRFQKQLSRKSKKEQKRILESSTDNDYILILNPITEEVDKCVELLMGQYYYGISAKQELNNLLIQILDNGIHE